MKYLYNLMFILNVLLVPTSLWAITQSTTREDKAAWGISLGLNLVALGAHLERLSKT